MPSGSKRSYTTYITVWLNRAPRERMAYRRDGEGDDDQSRRDGEREPHAGRNRLRTRRHESVVAEPSANSAPITDAPVISPRLRDRLSRPEMTPRCSGRLSVMTAVLLAAWNSA